MNQRLVLTLSPAEAEALFDGVVERAPGAAHALAALTALQTLIGCHSDPAAQGGEAHEAIRKGLERRLTRLREAVIDLGTEELGRALRRADSAAVARVHARLSRQAFEQAARRCLEGTMTDQGRRLVGWVQAWCRDAEARARAASPYPDALDWSAADIPVEQYLAMQDLQRGFSALA